MFDSRVFTDYVASIIIYLFRNCSAQKLHTFGVVIGGWRVETMVNPILTIPLVEQLHHALRHLNVSSQLTQLPLLTSHLVKQHQLAHPELSPPQVLHVLLTTLLAQLAVEQPKAADLLHGRFWEELTVAEMVQVNRPEAQSARRFYQQQEQALSYLALLWEQTEAQTKRAQHREQLISRLPMPTYDRLFGIDSVVDCLLHVLHDPNHHFILSLKGIGGIGKTALADYTVRHFLAEDDGLQDLVWISAKQEHLTPSGINGIGNGSATQIRLEHIFDELGYKLGLPEVLRLPLDQKVEKLAGCLRVAPHLVVIDNLETIADFQRLIPWLTRLASPTKFLLTSRVTIPSLMRVTAVELNELDRAASLALIESIAASKEVHDCDVARVHEVVGGNPLAIILLVSQMQTVPPAEVLKSVQAGSTEEIYRYIYWRSWRALTLPAQELLFAIQRAGDVADWEWLMLVSEAPAKTVQEALGQLVDLSLVQPQRGSAGQRTFAIHRLTSTFLRTEVLGWK